MTGLENVLGKQAIRHYVDVPNLGDVLQTHSNITAAAEAFNYAPQVCPTPSGVPNQRLAWCSMWTFLDLH